MKKNLFLILAMTTLLFSGCDDKISDVPQSTTIPEPSEVPQSSEVSVSVEESSFVVFPVGLSTYSKGKLQYTNSTLSLSVIFTDEFYIPNDDYKPQNGIYLQNADGTATLLLESVTDNTVSNEEMLEYLKETYPYTETSTNDNNEIICQHTAKDNSLHDIFTIQKIKLAEGGYKQMALSCRPSDKDKYIKVFNSINFS